MSNEEEHDHDDIPLGDDPNYEAIEALEDLGYGAQDKEVTITPSHHNEAVANHPKIKRILKNRNVSEVRVNWKRVSKSRIRQPYVCIVFNNGSTVERPLSDIEDDEEACGPTDIVPHGHGGRMEPREDRGGGWRRLFRRGGDFSRSEIQRFTDENGCTVVVKRAVIRKCNHRHHDRHDHDEEDHSHRRHHDCGCDCHKHKRGWFS